VSRIQAAIARRLAQGRRAFVPYLTAGHPDPETTRAAALALAGIGATALELGIPFSDPVADGPVLARAQARALAGGMTPGGALDLVRAIRSQSDIPLIIMSYVNPLMQFRGQPGAFAAAAAEAGADGLLVTDLPADEPHALWPAIDAAGLDSIVLVTPTTGEARLRAIAPRARGFVYCVSRLGVTGSGPEADRRTAALVAAARGATGLPVLLGFGIATAADAARAAALADGVVVGTALVPALEGPSPAAAVAALGAELEGALA
jgi:tryptophan synthase alpha chain